MHVVITDSGVGGLSVVAYTEREVRTRGFTEPLQLTFANAAPANDYGYNAMPSREAKIATFDRFLSNVSRRFAPDLIYVACNTLSVLLPDTRFCAEGVVPVKGIVETGAGLLLKALEADPQSIAIVFATQTTTDAGTYPRILAQSGIDHSRIVSQACPGLADAISEDREGTTAAEEIRRCVTAALAKLERPVTHAVAYLGCTHYGYRAEQFAAAFADAGITAAVVNPNERAVDDLLGVLREPATAREVPVRLVTRYPLPPSTVETLTRLLQDISPVTVDAIRSFEHIPDLF